MNITKLIFIFCLLIITSGCTIDYDSLQKKLAEIDQKTGTEIDKLKLLKDDIIANQLTEHSIEPIQKEEILKIINSLNIGDNDINIKNILGDANIDQKLFNENGEFIARKISYLLEENSSEIQSIIKEEAVELYFDAENKLKEIQYNNLNAPSTSTVKIALESSTTTTKESDQETQSFPQKIISSILEKLIKKEPEKIKLTEETNILSEIINTKIDDKSCKCVCE